jgi:hypothetical protein
MAQAHGLSPPPINPIISIWNIIYRHNVALSLALGPNPLQDMRIHLLTQPSNPKGRSYMVFFKYDDKKAEYSCSTSDDEDSYEDFKVMSVNEAMRESFGGDPSRLEWLERDDFGIRFVKSTLGEGQNNIWGFTRMGKHRVLSEERERLGVEDV